MSTAIPGRLVPAETHGRIDRFITLLPATDTSIVRFYRALADVERGRTAAADTAIAQAFERNPGDFFARLGMALNAGLSHHNEDARTALVALSRDRDAKWDRDGEFTFKQAQIFGLAGDLQSAVADLDRAVTQGFVCVACMESSSLLAQVRLTPQYQAVIERARVRHEAFGRRFGLANSQTAVQGR